MLWVFWRENLRIFYLADVLNIVSLDISDNHDLLLSQKVETQVVDGVSEDTLLDHNNVSSALNDLLDESNDVFPLLLQNLIDLAVVSNNDIAVQIGFWAAEAELKKGDFWVLNSAWSSISMADLVVGEDNSVAEFDIVDGSSQFLDDSDVAEVDIGVGFWVADLHDGVDGNWSQVFGVLGNDLGCQRSFNTLSQVFLVVDVDWGGEFIEDLKGLCKGNCKSV